MKKLAVMLAAAMSLAAFAKNDKNDDKNKGQHGKEMKAEHSSSGRHDDDDDHSKGNDWKPREVTKEDKRGIDAYYADAEAAMARDDLQAMARQIDFPVLMVTDDSRGQGSGEVWSREQWLRNMGQVLKSMPQDAKFSAKRKPFFITNDLVVVEIENRVQMGSRKMSYRSAELLIKRNGQWVSKANIEGGWGDAMGPGSQQGQGTQGTTMGPSTTTTPGGIVVTPPAEPKGPATATQTQTQTTQQAPATTAPPADPKGTSSQPGDPKGTTTTTTSGPKGTSGGTGDVKGATAPTTSTTGTTRAATAPDAGTPDAGIPTKGSAKGAIARPPGK